MISLLVSMSLVASQSIKNEEMILRETLLASGYTNNYYNEIVAAYRRAKESERMKQDEESSSLKRENAFCRKRPREEGVSLEPVGMEDFNKDLAEAL